MQNDAQQSDIVADPVIGTAATAKIANVSAVHLRRLIRAGKFPKPFRIGDRKLGWRTSTIQHHIADREAAASATTPPSTT